MTQHELEGSANGALDRSRNTRQKTQLLVYASAMTREQSASLKEENRGLMRKLRKIYAGIIPPPASGSSKRK